MTTRVLLALLLAAAIAGATGAVAQPTVTPDNVTSVPGTCTAYQGFLASTGATEPGGRTHPGSCQFTTFLPTVSGRPWSQYLAEVTAWGNALPHLTYVHSSDPNWQWEPARGPSRPLPTTGARRPYAIRGDVGNVLPGGRVCAQVVGFGPSFSATIQSSRLSWTPTAGAACSTEWNRVDPHAALAGRAATEANNLVQKTVAQLNADLQNRRFCGADRTTVERDIAAAIETLLERASRGAIGRWEAERPSFDGPGTGASNVCAIQCGLCASGWAGRIQCKKSITGPGGYHHDETQTWAVGGAAQASGGSTNFPVAWTAVGSGGAPGKSWAINASQATNLTVTVLTGGVSSFDRSTAAIDILSGIVGTPISFTLYEIDFPAFTTTSSTATGTWSRPTVGGDSPQQPGGSTGTLSCSWALDRQ